ncbi:MAG: MarC family protein [Pseudomonadota bacterium]
MDTAFLIKTFGAFFAIMNPFVNLPIFLSLTEGLSAAQQRRTALYVMAFSVAMCAVLAIAGQGILGFFGISVDDFRVAGGLVLLMIGLGMLNGSGNSSHERTAAERTEQPNLEQIAFYPMTFPMIVGPGTITALIVFYGQVDGVDTSTAFWSALIATLGLLGVVLFFAAEIGAHLSKTMRVIMTRLMGMILAAIAVDMIATGLRTLLPGLA